MCFYMFVYQQKVLKRQRLEMKIMKWKCTCANNASIKLSDVCGNVLLLTYHTPPKCMAKWLTSQNRNLVSANILHMRSSAAVHVMIHLNAWGQRVIDEGKEHERTTSPRIWLDFFSSEFYTHVFPIGTKA